MKRIIALIFAIVLLLPVMGWGEDLFVRPYNNGVGYGDKDGSSYEDAWEGFPDVVWGTSAGQVGPGDTLYICGTFGDCPSNPPSSMTWLGPENRLEPTVDGTEGNPITIRGDAVTSGNYPGAEDGVLWPTNRLFYSTTRYVFPTGVNGVYWSKYDGSMWPLAEVISGTPQLFTKRMYGLSSTHAESIALSVSTVNTTTDEITTTLNWPEDTRVVLYGADLPDGNPDPLDCGTIYYVINVDATHIKLETSLGGGAVDLIDTGSGTMYISQMPTDAQFNNFEAGEYMSTGAAGGYFVYFKPISSASNHFLILGEEIRFNGRSHIVFKNLVTCGVSVMELQSAPSNIEIDNITMLCLFGLKAIDIQQNAQNITIKNCVIDGYKEGIYHSVQGVHGMNNLQIYNNTISNIKWDGTDSHAIATQGGTNVKVHDNVIDTACTGVTFYVSSSYPSSDMEVYNNYIKNIFRFPTGQADGLSTATDMVDPSRDFSTPVSGYNIEAGDVIYNRTDGSKGTVTSLETTINNKDTVRCSGGLSGGTLNTWSKGDVWHVRDQANGNGNAPGSGHGAGIDTHGQAGNTTTFTVYNNIVRSAHNCAIRLNTENRITKVYNNTIDNSNIGIYMYSGLSIDPDNTDIRNNIITNPKDWCLSDGLPVVFQYVRCYTDSSGWDSTIYNNHCYYSVSGDCFYYVENGAYNASPITYAEFVDAMNDGIGTNEDSSITGDPDYVNAGGDFELATDFLLSSGSPCATGGELLASVTTDYWGTTRTDPYSIGAHELDEGGDIFPYVPVERHRRRRPR